MLDRIDFAIRRALPATVACTALVITACGPRRAVVIGPVGDPATSAESLERGTALQEPIRIDFDWQLNEAGARMRGRGVARIEPPYRARLDLFLDNGEGVVTAALVGDDLRLPYGSRDDVLPPVDLMWGTLGVFRPVAGGTLVGGERLEGEGERLRYRQADGTELHYETRHGRLEGVELLEGDDVVQFVRLERPTGARYPDRATYRNLQEFRELKIERTGLRPSEPFDPEIWDPRE